MLKQIQLQGLSAQTEVILKRWNFGHEGSWGSFWTEEFSVINYTSMLENLFWYFLAILYDKPLINS